MKNLMTRFKELFHSLNTAVKALIFIGFLAFAETILSIFWDANSSSPSDVAIRSVMSSIFGYIFGTKTTENTNISSRNLQTLIASIVAITCIIVSVVTDWIHVNQANAAVVEIRNLLFSAIGFLLSRARSND